MLSIFLSVLKIIGFVLLGIIGLILILLCIVLFVPIRYRFYIDKDKDEGFDVCVRGGASFLLHLLNVHIDYPSERLFNVRISFFTIFPRKEKKIRERKTKIEPDKKAKNRSEEYDIREECALPEEEGTEDETLFSQEEIVRESVFKDSETTKETSKDTSKESFKDFLLSIVDFVRNIKEKLSKFYNKIIDFKDNFEYYFGVINSNSFNHAFNKCKKEIVKLIKIILPRSVKGKIEFGGKEPSLTAQVYGFFNAFRTGAFRKLKLVPFLEEERFNGHIVIKGHFRIISVLFIAAKVYFNKDIKKTIKLFKRER